MFNSTVLEVAIGISFCYASVALIVSTANEAIASLLRLRARALLAGIKTMLNDPRFDGLALAVYRHALVNPQENGQARTQRQLKYRPSYIDPRHFAIALVDSVQTVPGDPAQLERDIEAIPDPQLRQLLGGLYRRAGGNLEAMQEQLAGWFDMGMERLSGAYKRRTQLMCVLLTLLFAVLFNIDSLHLFRTLWQQPAMAAHLGTLAPVLDQRALDALWTLPVGWEAFPPALDRSFLLQVAGWLLTASTGIFGAPFWFDILQRVVQLRGTGPKPSEAKAVNGQESGALPPGGSKSIHS